MGKQLVAAAAIQQQDSVLVARRSYPPALAGLWEFPGGKVEVAEEPRSALSRELVEELGITVDIGAEISPSAGGPWPINACLELRLWWATLTGPAQPQALGSHDRLLWCRRAELDRLDWLPADRPMLPRLRELWP